MKIRSELNDLASDIREAVTSWNGGEKIKIGEIDLTVAQVSKNVLDKLNEYLLEEKSLKCRVETTQNLLNVLEKFRDRSSNPDSKKDLLSVILKVDHIKFFAIQEQKKIEGKISAQILNKVNEYIKNTFLDNPHQKIKDAAFRTLKNVGFFEGHFVSADRFGSVQMVSFLTLKQDLEIFLSSSGHLLTADQRLEIEKAIPLLQTGAEMHGRMYNLYCLALENQPDDFIEMKIADLAYEFEIAIDNLKLGQSMIIPGGCQGHAVLYEVQRVREKEYHFSIFNTGLGNEFGQTVFDLIGSSQSRTSLFTGLTKEVVSDQKFLMNLIRFKTKPSVISMNPVHQIIQKQLGNPTTRELHDSQSWGTCSFDSVSAFLEYMLRPSLFIPFQYDMMLRARNKLNTLLPNGLVEKLFPEATLDFIDKKSCQTISEWKKKFDEHCTSINDDLVIAKIIHDMGIHDETTFKTILQLLVDNAFSLADTLHSSVSPIKTAFYIDYAAFLVGMTFSGPLALLVAFAGTGLLLKALIDSPPTQSLETACRNEQSRLESIQMIVEKTAPEEVQILKNRRESLAPTCFVLLPDSLHQPINRANLAGLNLRTVLSYLENRYLEIALCSAPLLNATFSPLREALQGCNMLPIPIK